MYELSDPKVIEGIKEAIEGTIYLDPSYASDTQLICIRLPLNRLPVNKEQSVCEQSEPVNIERINAANEGESYLIPLSASDVQLIRNHQSTERHALAPNAGWRVFFAILVTFILPINLQ